MRFLFVLLLAGCTEPPRCPSGFIGDRALAPEVQMLATDGRSMMQAPVDEGGRVPMEQPPQGGFVIYIGAAVRNVDGCGIELRGQLRDPQTGMELSADGRTSDLQRAADGWGRSDVSDNSAPPNVATCPDLTATPRNGGSFIVEIRATDKSGRSGSVSHLVTLYCDPAMDPAVYAECVCSCDAGYTPGKCNGFVLDGGMPD